MTSTTRTICLVLICILTDSSAVAIGTDPKIRPATINNTGLATAGYCAPLVPAGSPSMQELSIVIYTLLGL